MSSHSSNLVLATLAALLSSGCGSSNAPDPATPSDGAAPSEGGVEGGTSPDGGRVAGRLISVSQRSPLSRRTVRTEGRSVVSAEDGSFALDDVPAFYGLVVLEPDETSVSIYPGLSRRDPLIVHAAVDEAGPAPRATIAGMVSGVSFPLDPSTRIDIHLFSRATRYASWLLSTRVLRDGPAFGPMEVSWVGPGPVDGQLVVLGATWTEAGWRAATVATQPVTLSDGAQLSVDLQSQATSLLRLTGTADAADGATASGVSVRYHMPFGEGHMNLGNFPGAGRFAYAVPELAALGGKYCVQVSASDGRASGTLCRAEATAEFRFQLEGAPKLLKPMAGAPVTRETKYAWSAVPHAVYQVAFEPTAISRSTPRIAVYTRATELDWATMAAAGIEYPVGAEYTVRVGVVGPHESLDDAAGGAGILALDRDGFLLGTEEIVVTMIR